MPTVDVLTAVFFVAITTAIMGLGQLVNWLAGLTVKQNTYELHGKRGIKPRPLGSLTNAFAGIVPVLSAEVGNLDEDLRHAGLYYPAARNDFLAVRNFLVLLVVFATGLVLIALPPRAAGLTSSVVITGGILGIVIFSMPRIYLNQRANARVAAIRRSLPDALEVVAMALTGGVPLQAALERVARETFRTNPDLAEELELLRQQTEIGTLEQALKQLAQRLDIPEVQTLSALMSQSIKLGNDLVTALREYTENLRYTRLKEIEEQANKAGLKALFPITFLILPSIFLLLWMPALLEIRRFFRDEREPGGLLDRSVTETQRPVDLGAR